MEWIWIGIIISLVLVELMSLNFAAIFFVFSGLISLILFHANQDYVIQVSVFLLVGLGLIIIVRPKIIDKIVIKRDDLINKIITKYTFTKRLFPKDIIDKLTKPKNNKDRKKNVKKKK